jgi:GNAT superfamily N-acetyltransferase
MSEEYRTITLNADNVADEHICCAIGNDAVNAARADQKREWLRHQFPHGHIFKKIDVRGKVFIEYVPAERAWAPIEATGYTFIQCFWVSGRFKGQGLGRRLLEECEADVTDTNGLVAITSPKKKPFMVEKKFYLAHGFELCDQAEPYFELVVKRFEGDAPLPTFRDQVREPELPGATGLDFFYSDTCPFNGDFVAELADIGRERGLEVRIHKTSNAEEAQSLPAAWGIYSLFYNGKFVAHDITPPKKFPALLDQLAAEG